MASAQNRRENKPDQSIDDSIEPARRTMTDRRSIAATHAVAEIRFINPERLAKRPSQISEKHPAVC
jgi:hypothetical protein